jgi:hypothetical protein
MAFIPPQMQIDQQRENQRLGGVDMLLKGIDGLEENRRRALDERMREDQLTMAQENHGYGQKALKYQDDQRMLPVEERDDFRQATALEKLRGDRLLKQLEGQERIANKRLANSPANQPKLEMGYRYAADGQTVEPIPGGMADQKRKDMVKKEQAGNETIVRNGQILIRELDQAMGLIDKEGQWAAGAGAPLKHIPLTSANQMDALIKSIEGTVGINSLMDMKKGGVGLGQVPQSQLEMLSTLMGSLRQNLPPQQLRKNMSDIKEIYSDIVSKIGGDPNRLVKGGASGGWGGGQQAPAPVNHPQTNQALEWAKQNPQDPRAIKILQTLGAQ